MDARVERLIESLEGADLEQVPADQRETSVAKVLSKALERFPRTDSRSGVGVDGSTRRPDDARILPGLAGCPPLAVAVEYKCYRNRHGGAGEMDRALGQCISYAEKYDAVLFYVVYMAEPEHSIPAHWMNRSAPLRVGHHGPGVPVYFAARPRSWSVPWAACFRRSTSRGVLL
jgi:hypothetical protein